jgi:hypothetical protein
MVGRHGVDADHGLSDLAAAGRYPPIRADETLGGQSTETENQPWLDSLGFGNQPGAAGRCLRAIWPLVKAALTPRRRFPTEVLDGVGDVDAGPIDSRLDKGVVKHPACRPHEDCPLKILPITWLLPDEHQTGRRWSGSGNGLGGAFPEITGSTGGDGRGDVTKEHRLRNYS